MKLTQENYENAKELIGIYGKVISAGYNEKDKSTYDIIYRTLTPLWAFVDMFEDKQKQGYWE